MTDRKAVLLYLAFYFVCLAGLVWWAAQTPRVEKVYEPDLIAYSTTVDTEVVALKNRVRFLEKMVFQNHYQRWDSDIFHFKKRGIYPVPSGSMQMLLGNLMLNPRFADNLMAESETLGKYRDDPMSLPRDWWKDIPQRPDTTGLIYQPKDK